MPYEGSLFIVVASGFLGKSNSFMPSRYMFIAVTNRKKCGELVPMKYENKCIRLDESLLTDETSISTCDYFRLILAACTCPGDKSQQPRRLATAKLPAQQYLIKNI